MASTYRQIFIVLILTLFLCQVKSRFPPAMAGNSNLVNTILGQKEASRTKENIEYCSIDILKQFLSVEGVNAILTVVAKLEETTPVNILQTLAVMQGIHEKDSGHLGSNFLSPMSPRSPNFGLKKHFTSTKNKYGGQENQNDRADVKFNRLQTRHQDSEVFESEPDILQQNTGSQYIKSENKFHPVGIEYEEPQTRIYSNDVTKLVKSISNSNLKTKPANIETPNGLPKAFLVLLNSDDDVIVHRWVDLAPKTSFLDLLRLARDEADFAGLQSIDNSFVFKLKKNNMRRCLGIEYLGPLKSTPSNPLIIKVFTSSLKVLWNDACLPKVADLLIYSGYVVTISKGQTKFTP
ncbi:UNVERIFIED_CONTAM: hypothetical protein RMT77_007890 [Armadillidium vulgare]